MTTLEATAAESVWLPLQDAATALQCSTDTLRRKIKKGALSARMNAGRYVVQVDAARVASSPTQIAVVEDVHPSVRELLNYVRERDAVRDQELVQLRKELARARADLISAQTALPPANGKPWGPFAWVRQLWATQT